MTMFIKEKVRDAILANTKRGEALTSIEIGELIPDLTLKQVQPMLSHLQNDGVIRKITRKPKSGSAAWEFAYEVTE